MDFIADGCYVIRNKRTGTVVDLSEGSNANGARVQGFASNSGNAHFLHQIWFIKYSGISDGKRYYTVTNGESGTLLDLSGGSGYDETVVQGWAANGTNAQSWWIYGNNQSGGFVFTNVAGRTVLDLKRGDPANGAQIQGYKDHNGDNQKWYLDIRSKSLRGVEDLLKVTFRNYSYYIADLHYIRLPDSVVSSIRDGKQLISRKERPEASDSDDFVFSMRGAVSDWSYDNLHAPIAIFFGITNGKYEGTDRSFNFNLSEDLNSIVLYDPKASSSDARPDFSKFSSKIAIC